MEGETLPGTGTFPVANDAAHRTKGWGATFEAVDSACHDRAAQTATSGTVTISKCVIAVTNPSDSHVDGSFDLTFPSGRLTGTFSSLYCEPPSSDAAPPSSDAAPPSADIAPRPDAAAAPPPPAACTP